MSIKKYIFQFRVHITIIISVVLICISIPKILESKNLTVPVVVAKRNIEIGTKLSTTDVIKKSVAKGILPKDTLTSINEVAKMQSSSFLPAGSVISKSQISNIGVLKNIPENKVVISVALTNSNLVKQGDRVNLIKSANNEYFESNTDCLSKNSIVISVQKQIQIAVSQEEAEKILSLPVDSQIHAILVH